MKYRIETVLNMVKTAREIGAEYEAMEAENIKPCISTGNTKIGKVLNVSLMPVITCGNCRECMCTCYDVHACVFHGRNVISARMRNTVLLTKDRDRYFSEIEKKVSRRRKNKYMRWHVAGDIMDYDYFDRMCGIAERHPDFTFWTYTKMYSIVNRWISENGALPSNLHVMFSAWTGVKMDNPYNLPMYICRLEGDSTDYKCFHCPGNCDVCKKSGRGCIASETTWIDEH